MFGRILAILIFLPNLAFAFPANVRHGYPNCTACHVSPGGGGVLTAYGRALSREVQSTFGSENETAFLYGVVPTPEWLDAGGDVRYLQLITDTDQKTTGQSFWMQADVEAAAHFAGRWTADIAIGWKGNSEVLANDADVKSRRHYLIYSVTDPAASVDQWTIRAGKFYPIFGVMPAEHYYQTRQGLGFDEGDESYNLEVGEMNEKGSFFFTPILGKARATNQSDERGFAASKYFALAGNHRLGFSALYGKELRQPAFDHRWVFGTSGVVSILKPLFWVGEFDYEYRVRSDGLRTLNGMYFTQKLTYEPVQGAQISVLQDLVKSDKSDPNTLAWTLGPVVDLYPRPHMDIQLSANRAFLPGNLPGFWNYVGMFHFYL